MPYLCLFVFIVSCYANTVNAAPKIKDAASAPVRQIPIQIIERIVGNLVRVEGGEFVMGSDDEAAHKHEKPARKVNVNSFYIAKTELTQQDFEAVMGWNYSYFACPECPINNISWYNMQLFLSRLNAASGLLFRLPTEAEWAFAARGGNKSKGYRFSGSNNIDEVAWYAKNAKRRSHRVAQKKANELGLYDMTGNLWEFCHDDMSRKAYSTLPSDNPVYSITDDLTKKTMKVMRGGGYEFSAEESLVYRRDGATNNVRLPDVGFRLAITSLDKQAAAAQHQKK